MELNFIEINDKEIKSQVSSLAQLLQHFRLRFVEAWLYGYNLLMTFVLVLHGLLILHRKFSILLTSINRDELANLPAMELIHKDDSPSGSKLFVLWNPLLRMKTIRFVDTFFWMGVSNYKMVNIKPLFAICFPTKQVVTSCVTAAVLIANTLKI
ncbi:hypothetical protein L1987_44906 [Smallanthus sonchifolius]|uniref:Uncharacterized protein n=1 Tax=Smallanthus sonchifolius TaxID=185202 RepID=A0ACB9GRE0_9ASTR|nr:hypothetical protein L1987_44906 [Smallanthus sonchifolius]